MKPLLLFCLLLSTLVSLSQPNKKHKKTLLDSLNEMECTEYIFETQRLQKVTNNLEIELKRERRRRVLEVIDVSEYSLRQKMYRDVVDNLELGIDIKHLFNHPLGIFMGEDYIVKILEANKFTPIYICIDSTDTFDIELGNDIEQLDRKWKGQISCAACSYKDFGKRLQQRDSILVKLYPRVYKLIDDGKIIFYNCELSPLLALATMPIVHFPSPPSNLLTTTIREKQQTANELLEFLTVKLKGFVEGNAIKRYLEIEKKNVPRDNIDNIIRLRRNFISLIKAEYEKQNPQK